MTHIRIQEVLQVARDNYDCPASLSDAIALLDMCHCFADNVASSRMPWCRPIAIRNGRYAIDVTSSGTNTREHEGSELRPE